ncbi:unnamed protein product [Discosporangium mesarthrocarpum]
MESLHLSEPHMFLFDLSVNPGEDTNGSCAGPVEACSNLYGNPTHTVARNRLERLLDSAREDAVPSSFLWADDGPLADPANFEQAWIPWRDEEGAPLALYRGGKASGNSVSWPGGAQGQGEGRHGAGCECVADVGCGAMAPMLVEGTGVSDRVLTLTLSNMGLGILGLAVTLTLVGVWSVAYRAGKRANYKAVAA